jgi:hypothetical protein
MLIYRYIQHQSWYGCYIDTYYMNCVGPFNNAYTTQLYLQTNLKQNYNPPPYYIVNTCAFIPEFLRRIKINRIISAERDLDTHIHFTKV